MRRAPSLFAALVAVATALMAGAGPARSQAFYVGGEGGWTDLEDQTGHLSGGTAERERFDSGYNVGARAGYEMGPWRFEAEYNYRRDALHGLSLGAPLGPLPAGAEAGVGGSRTTNALMANLIYDFAFGWPLSPHLGVGAGAADVSDDIGTAAGTLAHSSDWEFAYQGIAGLRYDITPSLAFDLDYRYFATVDPRFHLRPAFGGAALRTGYDAHNVVASLSVKFGAPPPPPPIVAPPAEAPVPPAPVAPKLFLIFFDWDRDTITPEGLRIVEEAARAYKAGAAVRLQVTGYTDRSGSAGYNQRLSERRANNVADALVRRGVARSDMTVAGRGENENRVPTADGVREPQNRRVEILLPSSS